MTIGHKFCRFELLHFGTRAYLFTPDEGSFYAFSTRNNFLRVSSISWCYFSKCSSFWCFIVVFRPMSLFVHIKLKYFNMSCKRASLTPSLPDWNWSKEVIIYKNQCKGTVNKIFTCFMIRVIRLELLSDLTSDALKALNWFMAWCAECSKIFTNNAIHFMGANTKLKTFYRLIPQMNHCVVI